MNKFQRCKNISIALSEEMGVWARCRHFSFILDRNRIVSVGINSKKTHPANLMFNYVNRRKEPISFLVGTHSEMKAMLSIGMKECRGLTIINTRIDRKGNLALSKPCKGCMEMINKAGFEEIWYTDDNGEFKNLT